MVSKEKVGIITPNKALFQEWVKYNGDKNIMYIPIMSLRSLSGRTFNRIQEGYESDNVRQYIHTAAQTRLTEEPHSNNPIMKHCMPDEITTKEEHHQYLIDSGAIKIYAARLAHGNNWQVEDQHKNIVFQGTEIECLLWIDTESK